MPRVLRIINRFNLGGPTYNAAYLTKHLGGDYTSLLIGGQKEDSEDSSDFILRHVGVHPFLIPEMQRSLNYNNDIKAYFKIKSIIERFKPDGGFFIGGTYCGAHFSWPCISFVL